MQQSFSSSLTVISDGLALLLAVDALPGGCLCARRPAHQRERPRRWRAPVRSTLAIRFESLSNAWQSTCIDAARNESALSTTNASGTVGPGHLADSRQASLCLQAVAAVVVEERRAGTRVVRDYA